MKFPCSKAKGKEDQSLALLLKSIPIKTEFIHLALFEIWKLFQIGGGGGGLITKKLTRSLVGLCSILMIPSHSLPFPSSPSPPFLPIWRRLPPPPFVSPRSRAPQAKKPWLRTVNLGAPLGKEKTLRSTLPATAGNNTTHVATIYTTITKRLSLAKA